MRRKRLTLLLVLSLLLTQARPAAFAQAQVPAAQQPAAPPRSQSAARRAEWLLS